ncbi:hypothetical protein QFW82_23575 [Streptomyces malaysiensis subsp. malaysiensis]|uniref:hypothetical protein n=1 Tax=Streptomyces malaysiensis TaxID=92644 RepID=UPI0024BFCBB3|nr:hypothetical protein [Streptomyces sp. NA07423]WHX19812.1 hypothetical protein QFW82_23575 [Streptomyces sp. NA07423]
MSDDADRQIERLDRALNSIYDLLVSICARLPIPITLPQGPATDGNTIPAVKRMIEIIDDQPLTHQLTVGIWSGALHWLSAAHLLDMLRTEWDHSINLAVQLNLTAGGETLMVMSRDMKNQQ